VNVDELSTFERCIQLLDQLNGIASRFRYAPINDRKRDELDVVLFY
jgi:hypothetical protein